MFEKEKLKNIHQIYNLARYIYLRIEHDYNKIVEASGITLPQLRVLWIINSFPGISLGEIARIGYWAPPTVTKMIRSLINKGLVVNEEGHNNRKIYSLSLASAGEEYININKQGSNDRFPLIKLGSFFSCEDIDFLVDMFKKLAINNKNHIIIPYIESINKNALKIDYNLFSTYEKQKLMNIVWFYNLLRTFILNVEGEHRQYLLKYAITYPQLRALWILEANPGITSMKLSEISFLSPSTVNVIVKNLYKKGLIYKEKSQVKNALFLYISQSGENLIIEDFKENQTKLSLKQIIESFSDEEISKIVYYLGKMNSLLGNDRVESYIKSTFEVIEKNYFAK